MGAASEPRPRDGGQRKAAKALLFDLVPVFRFATADRCKGRKIRRHQWQGAGRRARPLQPGSLLGHGAQPDRAARADGARGGEEYHGVRTRSEEHTSELQSLMRISYAAFCLKKKKNN